jgi:UDP-4-amino-4,6-dideoxy-N-acetyl-beta-L-altrosamine transaminase
MKRAPARKLRAKAASGPFLPYGRQLIEDDDVEAVVEALHAEFLTTGPVVEQFERKLAETVGAADTIACSNGTAALFMAAKALDLGHGRTVVVPAITFLATASAPHLAGAEIIFADVDRETGLMRAEDLEEALTRAPGGRADAVFPVHYAGQSCDMAAIARVARAREMRVVEDAAHALGTAWLQPDGAVVPVGANLHGDLTIFSFHPVKTIAMGEGGAVSANDPELVRRLRRLRNHGITREPAEFLRKRAAFENDDTPNPWYYELHAPGFNFRVPDLNCALGLSQLTKLPRFVAQRAALVAAYDEMLASLVPIVRPLARERSSASAWHLYAVHIDFAEAGIQRGALMSALKREGIGTQVHYIPVNRQPYFAARTGPLVLPGAEHYYAHTLSLPLHAGMTTDDVERVCTALSRHLS